MTRPLILDVDTGVDDAMALALATRLTTHELVAVTTVAGNVPIDLATLNTLRVLAWLDVDVPVFRGMSRPLVRPLHTATSVHGNDGLGGWVPAVAERLMQDTSAPEKIVSLASSHRGEIDGVFVGPLTNLAVALALEPEIVNWFRQVTIMGGSFTQPGNVSSAAEFNVYVDPEAAAIVARSGLSTTWIGLDVTHQTSLTASDWKQLAQSSAPSAELVREVCRTSIEVRGREAVYLHDPLAVAVATDPDLVETRDGQVLVDTGNFARGETRIADGRGTSLVATTVDSQRFRTMFRSVLEM